VLHTLTACIEIVLFDLAGDFVPIVEAAGYAVVAGRQREGSGVAALPDVGQAYGEVAEAAEALAKRVWLTAISGRSHLA
jgi:hypothetical protein